MKKKILTLITAVLIASLAFACGAEKSAHENEAPEREEEQRTENKSLDDASEQGTIENESVGGSSAPEENPAGSGPEAENGAAADNAEAINGGNAADAGDGSDNSKTPENRTYKSSDGEEQMLIVSYEKNGGIQIEILGGGYMNTYAYYKSADEVGSFVPVYSFSGTGEIMESTYEGDASFTITENKIIMEFISAFDVYGTVGVGEYDRVN